MYRQSLYEYDIVRSSDRTDLAAETAAFCKMFLNNVHLSLAFVYQTLT
jgi:hypothetical protein